jgi:hypothetical protein
MHALAALACIRFRRHSSLTRRIALGEDSVVEHPQPRKLVADAAHLGVNFGDHVLELIRHCLPLALRLRSGAAKVILRGED